MFLTNISLKRPTFAIVVILVMLILGVVSFMGLNLNDMPQAEFPYVLVNVVMPGAAPDQIETKVTKIVEDAVGQISGVKHITSYVRENYCMILMEFDDSRNPEEAAQDVRAKMSSIRNTLPSNIQEPVISKIDINAQPILSLAITGEMSKAELSNFVDKTIIPELNAVNGVGSVDTYGMLEREIQIKVDKDKLAAYHLTIQQVMAGLSSDNIDLPSGKVSDSEREVTLRTYSSIENVQSFNDIIVATINGTEIRLGSIAEVIDGFETQDSISFYNGSECIGVDLVKQSGTNTVEVSDAVKQKLAQMEKQLPAGAQINVVSDNSKFIRSSVHSVEKTMIEGCVLAVVIIFLFLRNWPSTLISALALPTSIITTFAAMKLMGFTLNTLSLLALSLSVGLLIDDAIVVIENIIRHLDEGKTPFQAAKEATTEISLAVLATTFAIVAVFLPMGMMKGIIGPFFKEFGLTIAVAVVVSLFISFTLVPLMSARYIKGEGEHQAPKTIFGKLLLKFNQEFDRLAVYYHKMLGVILDHRKKTLLITGGILVLSLFLVPLMGMEFVPAQDQGTITVTGNLDAGLALDVATQTAHKMENIVEQYPEVVAIYSTVKNDSVTLNVELTDKEERKLSADAIGAKIRTEIKAIPGIDLSVSGASGMGDQSGKNFAMHIQGDNFEELLEYSQQAKQLLAEIPGAMDVGISYRAGKPETKIVVDRDIAADLGVTPASVSSTLGVLFNGQTVGQYIVDGDQIDVKLSVEDRQSANLDEVSGIYVNSTTTGNMISIDQLVKKEYGTASSQIERYDKSRDIQVQANAVNITSTELGTAFLQKLNEELPPPAGIYISSGGDQQMMEESMADLMQALILGVLFIFLILAAQFENWIDPLAIMFSLPLAMIGAIVGLFVTGSGFSMIGMIGIIFLMGLVTKNAILLVDFIKTRREEGLNRREAILEAGLIRLRPIMMTTLAMIFGMLPSAMDTSVGAEMRQPMAIAIIGGLISSTLLTLLVIPVVYTLLDDLKGKLKIPVRKKEPKELKKTESVTN